MSAGSSSDSHHSNRPISAPTDAHNKTAMPATNAVDAFAAAIARPTTDLSQMVEFSPGQQPPAGTTVAPAYPVRLLPICMRQFAQCSPPRPLG